MKKSEINAISQEISEETAIQLLKIKGLSLLNAVIIFSETIPGHTKASIKREILEDVNKQLNTKYEMKHIDNWVSGRAATPKRVKEILQLSVLQYLFADEAAQILHDVLRN
ncbi:MAG TPA: hypothetical protein ENK06_01515 [Gammaproteobacteria bacterium]|nr:hypothetical protein [Gammaproteobacteria bacterium]